MKHQAYTSLLPQPWGDRLKGAQFGFIAGLVIGLIFGWFFHGIISLALRLGVLLLLLLPLIVIGWFWFRSRRASQGGSPPSGSRVTWTAVGSMSSARRPEPPSDPGDDPGAFVDVPVTRPTARSRPEDIELELEALKRQRERGA